MNDKSNTTRKLKILAGLLLATSSLSATHVVGGYMNYYCTSNGNFIVQLFMYRDCNGVPLPGTYEIGVFDAANNYVMSINAPKVYEINVPPITTNPCLSPPSWVCVHEALYEANVTLSNSNGGYTLAAQECCRNNTIDNIVNPGAQGGTYMAKIPDPGTTGCNDAPLYTKMPPIAICDQDTFKYDHSALDLNGDSIVYYLCDAKDAPTNPPSPPQAPPYSSVPYQSPYTAGYPMPASPALSIDPQTGFLTAWPNGQGTYVVSICTDEFRNGVKIGEYRREIQFNVVSCSVAVNAAIGGSNGPGTDIYNCESYTVQFSNMSTGAPYFWWDFGTGNPGDTSTQTSPSFTYSDTGVYLITLIANKGYPCADTTTAYLYLYPGMTTNFTWSTPVCQSVAVNFTNSSTVTYGSITSYSWTFQGGSPGTSTQQNPTVTWSTSGSKNVTLIITSSMGCADTIVKQVYVNPTPPLTVPGDITICVGTDTQLVATGNGTFAWTPPGSGLSCYNCNNPIAAPTTNTVYSVTLTALSGCKNTKTVKVNRAAYPVVNAGADVVLCGPAITQFNATGTDTSGALAWKWTPTTGLSSPFVSNPIANPNPGVSATYTYCVTATNQYGCASTDCLVLKRNIVTVDAGPDKSYCAGGSATLNGSTPNTNVTWAWSPPASISGSSTVANPTANPTTTTVFTATITDADGCNASDTTTVTVYPLPNIFAGSNTSICPGGSTTLTASGAGAGGSYVWQPGGQTTASITVSPVNTTTYTVTGTSSDGCSKSATVTVFVLNEPLVTVTPDTFMCQGVALQLTSSGPAGSTYLWSPSIFLSNPNVANPIANPPVPGQTYNYNLTITDPSGCVKDTSVSILVRANPNVNTSTTDPDICIGQSTSISATGAGAGGTYTWMPGNMNGTPQTVTPSTPTTYTVIGTDMWGCKDYGTVAITVNPLPTVTPGPNQAICAGGSATITVSGNAASYAWQPGGQTGTSITVSPANTTTYTVTGTSAAGCQATAQVTVTVNPLPNVTATTPTPDICIGASATLNAAGANTYLWMPGSLTGASVSVSPSGTTTYTVTGTDGNGCQKTATVTVTVHALPSVSATTPTPDICAGASATLTASGASSYSWMPGAITGNPVTVSPSSPTSYTVTGTDSWGCQNTNTVSVTVHQAPSISAGPDKAMCIGGSVSLTASGAGAGGSYLWQPGNLSGATITVSPSGNTTYTVTGTDQWGCTGTDDALVTVNNLPQVTASTPTPDICVGASATLNGNGAVTYNWQPGNLSGSSVTVTPGSSTTYTVTGTDANGCTATASVLVTVHTLPNISGGNDQDICANGTANLTASGAGSGGTYVWNPGNLAGQSITVSPASTTTYTVTGTDSWGCSNGDQVAVIVHQPPSVSAGIDKQFCEGGSTTLTATGAQTYVWQPGGQTTATITVSGLAVGTYTYTVTGTDQWGCVNNDQANVVVNALPTITISPDTSVCLGEATALTAGGGVSYVWQPGSITGNPATVSPLSNTTYTVTGTDANGCSNTNSVTVTVKSLPNVDAGLDVAICVGESTQLLAAGAVSYTWTGAGLSDPNIPDPVATPGVTTTYQVTGVGANGCSNTDVVVVDVNPLPNITANPDIYVYKGECAQLSVLGGVSYTWNPPTFLDDPSVSQPYACPDDTMVYYVTGTDQNGCKNTDSTIVFVVGRPITKIPTAFSPNGDGLNDVFRIEVYENFNLVRLMIFSRWGDLIHETDDIAAGWDGTAFGHVQPIGTYVYMIEGVDEKGAAVWRQGNVTLIR